MTKWFTRLILLFLLFKISTFPVSSDENFSVSYDVVYRFAQNNNALVTQTTTLTNKKTNLFATRYEGSIYGTVIGEITGFDPSGPIQIASEKKNDKQTLITAQFKEKTVGEGSKSTFSINYTLSGLVSQNGRIKEIAIPRALKDEGVTDYKVTVIIPQSMGSIGFVKPQKDYQETGTSLVFSFNTQQSMQGILIGIGDVAHYSFEITYHLTNNSLIKRELEIAIPPDTSYQQVLYRDIVPRPDNVTTDQDGNWIASFILAPKEDRLVTLQGNVLIWTTPRPDFVETPPIGNHILSNKYWETESSIVAQTAKGLNSAYDIYSYLVNTFSYNYARVGDSENRRMGASEILKNPALAICMEFTDAFITLARKIGIPAREVNGYAYTQDEFLKPLSLVADVLHAWPEYWDSTKKRWIAVDPTWGNTTGGFDYFTNLDFNHFVFVRHGVSSTYPPAAGAYKKTGNEKDVIVAPQEGLPQIPDSRVLGVFDIPKAVISAESQRVSVSITNTGGIARYDVPVSITGNDISVSLPNNKINLPPYSKVTIEGTLTANEKVWGETVITAIAGDTREDLKVTVSPKQVFQIPLLVGILALLLALLLYAIRKKYAQKRRV